MTESALKEMLSLFRIDYRDFEKYIVGKTACTIEGEICYFMTDIIHFIHNNYDIIKKQ